MKRHPFLSVELNASVKLTPRELKSVKLWLDSSSPVFEKLVRKKLLPAHKSSTFTLSVLLCGDSRMRKLNSDHRGKDKVTDVLSFPFQENLRRETPPGVIFLGDLAICHQQTRRQAKKFGITYREEFIHLFFHGLLHLLGYDHERSREEERLMEKWEEEALELFSETKKGS